MNVCSVCWFLVWRSFVCVCVCLRQDLLLPKITIQKFQVETVKPKVEDCISLFAHFKRIKMQTLRQMCAHSKHQRVI